jgi:hypothetical protein
MACPLPALKLADLFFIVHNNGHQALYAYVIGEQFLIVRCPYDVDTMIVAGSRTSIKICREFSTFGGVLLDGGVV